METVDIAKWRLQFQTYISPVPADLDIILERALLGSEDRSSLEPWYLCPLDLVMSIKQYRPKARYRGNAIIFAWRSDMDHVACIESSEKEGYEVVEIHFEIGNPKHLEVTARFDSVWAWLKSAIDDVQIFCRE